MPYLDNNIPSKKFYASIGCEIPRMVGTTDPISMMKHVNLLVIRMKNEGSECPILKKIFAKHFKVFKGYLRYKTIRRHKSALDA